MAESIDAEAGGTALILKFPQECSASPGMKCPERKPRINPRAQPSEYYPGIVLFVIFKM